MPRATQTRDPIVQRIEQLVVALLEDKALRVAKRCTRNVAVDETGVLTLVANPVTERVQLKRCAYLTKVLEQVYRLKVRGMHASKRDIYYMDTALFGGQQTVNEAIDDIARSFRVQRGVLNINTTCKGIVVGNLSYRTANGNLVNAANSKQGTVISVDEPTEFHLGNVRCVLIVEKDATLMRLIDDGAVAKLGCVLITGKGYPCIATRRFVHLLHKHTGTTVPFYILTDCDPHGLHIAATYCLGSVNLSHENHHLAVPSMTWLGLTPADIAAYNLPPTALLQCTPHDVSKAHSLLVHPSLPATKPSWVPSIRHFASLGVKAEIQALQAEGLCFLTDTYLPQKLGMQ